ncbi:hypothetical protein SGGMMB4_05292 [Sodalis glossinidius str. 'morsitans']|uniref:Uncharacterized protein n=1 Tax=Sodalis glossinidius (strain morsitans) TaxID=343509 RepID=A0A193QNQ8_SODGM|nr:hypothetical protein SGGMMB4_05292 [Sodalis glossinidius str. 'morsitans']
MSLLNKLVTIVVSNVGIQHMTGLAFVSLHLKINILIYWC